MASILQCGHLRTHTVPYVFASERAELIHVNAQLNSLHRHISELNTLQNTLHYRSSQLQYLLSPIYAFPTEILSYIFQLAVNPESYSSKADYNQDWLRRAFVLSSVSSHFHYVAFGTPELWNRIPLRLNEGNPIDRVQSLLQHCIVRAPKVTVYLFDGYSYEGGEDLCSVIETLFTSDTTRKVKAFELYSLNHASSWISKLTGSPFPIIETLTITCGFGTRHLPVFDFGTLNNLTRLDISRTGIDFPITVPLSVQYLRIGKLSQEVFVSLLYQCPNLVECSAGTIREPHGPPFVKPLVLNHLKQLYTRTMHAIEESSSLQHIQLPSLESLRLDYFTKRHSLDIVPFCCNVSATLTSLTILTRSETLDYDDLYKLFRSTFPKLRVLEFDSVHLAPLMSAFRALSPLDGEYNNPRPLHLPALESITLQSYWAEAEPCILLDSLKNWWSDEVLHLRFELQNHRDRDEDWTPALKEEFRVIKGSRQIEIIWGGDMIEHSHVESSSLQLAIE